MKNIVICMTACLVLTVSCTLDEDYYVDFSQVKGNSSMFKAVSTKTTDLSNGYPDETTLPDGTPVNDFLADSLTQTKATSTSVADFVLNFIKWEKKSKVIEISGVYRSVGENGDSLTLSGKVVIPAKGEIKRIILVSHYTIGSNAQAPSNSFPIEGQLASLGYAIVVPDYIGFGVTNDHYHPYLMMELTAKNVIDMYKAVVPFLKAIDRAPENDDIYLMGYSQGGATTMAVEYMIERDYSADSSYPIKIKRVFAGGGIYDIKSTFEEFIETNVASYPCGVPYVLVGQIKGNHLSDSLITRLIQPKIQPYIKEWFLDKTRTTGEMNNIIDTHVTSEILTDVAFDRTSSEVTKLYQVMTANSVLSLSWVPEAPVYMLHSIDDDTVPFENATRAKVRWEYANIQYNFGHYGSHTVAALRFIYTVKTILQDED